MTQSIPEIHAVGLTTRKALGEAAEAAFLAKATSLGFGVAKTWGDSERYDFILDSGQERWRVQVKSCRYFRSCYHVATRGATRAYTTDEVDFIVVYIVPENLWYVFPISLAALRNRIYISPNRPLHSENEKYREAWCQLACPRHETHPTRLLVKRLQGYPFDACKLCDLKRPPKNIPIHLTRDRRGRWQKSPVLAQARRDQRNRQELRNV